MASPKLTLAILGLCCAAAFAGSGCSIPEASGISWSQYNVSCVEVSFEGGDGITLYGSLLQPNRSSDMMEQYNMWGAQYLMSSSASTDNVGLVFISGSGPNDRWSCDSAGISCTFLDIAATAASRGASVLVYDKRSCSSGYNDMCSNRKFCTDLPESATGYTICSECPGCMNLYNTTLYQYIDDAVAATTYLQNTVGVAVDSTVVVGHSQGCSYAPEVAARVGCPNVVLLEGTGVGPGAILSLQSEFQLPLYVKELEYLNKTGASAADIQAVQQQIGVSQCYVDYSVPQMNTIRDGKLGPWLYTNPAVNSFPVATPLAISSEIYAALVAKGINASTLRQMGIVENGILCPGHDITGAYCACDANHTQNRSCALLCSGAQVAGNGPSVGYLFYKSWIEVGSLSYMKNSLARLPPHARLLATNGWADAKVPLDVFKALHELLTLNTSKVTFGTYPLGEGNPALSNSGLLRLALNTFSNMTHDLTDINEAYDGSTVDYFHTREDLQDTVMAFVCSTHGAYCSTNDAVPIPPNFLLVASIVGVLAGFLVGIAATLFMQWARYQCLVRKARSVGIPVPGDASMSTNSTAITTPNYSARGLLRQPQLSTQVEISAGTDAYTSLDHNLHTK